MKCLKPLFIAMVAMAAVLSCKKTKETPAPPPTPETPVPVIASIFPDNGVWSTVVTISGNNFSTTLTNNTVLFNGKAANVLTASATQLTVETPKGAGTGLVSVQVDGKTANGPVFTYAYITRVSTLAGSISGFADGTGAAAKFANLYHLYADKQGSLYATDMNKIRKITPDGVVSTFAGSTYGHVDGPIAAAQFQGAVGICADAQGNMYVSEVGNFDIRKITPAGVVSTLAGGGVSGDVDGTGTNARFTTPSGLCADAKGNIYLADGWAAKVRKITPAGVVTTVAGSTMGDADGAGAMAQFEFPSGICIDSLGNLFVGDQNRIRRITPAGVVSTFAGSITAGYADGSGTAAQFSSIGGLCIDPQGNLYAAEYAGNKVRMITRAGVVTTIAGNSTAGFADGAPFVARFHTPYGICYYNGNLFIGDGNNYKIRQITME